MERLNELRQEYERTKLALNFPIDLVDRQRHRERRNAILLEARALGASLNLSGEHWFNVKE